MSTQQGKALGKPLWSSRAWKHSDVAAQKPGTAQSSGQRVRESTVWFLGADVFSSHREGSLWKTLEGKTWDSSSRDIKHTYKSNAASENAFSELVATIEK